MKTFAIKGLLTFVNRCQPDGKMSTKLRSWYCRYSGNCNLWTNKALFCYLTSKTPKRPLKTDFIVQETIAMIGFLTFVRWSQTDCKKSEKILLVSWYCHYSMYCGDLTNKAHFLNITTIISILQTFSICRLALPVLYHVVFWLKCYMKLYK